MNYNKCFCLKYCNCRIILVNVRWSLSHSSLETDKVVSNQWVSVTQGSFHAKSPKIRKISRVTISDFDENWLKCSSTYMMATCKKVLSSGDKFDFYSHIYKGGVFPISYSRCRFWMFACFKMMISFVFFKISQWKFILYQIVIWEIEIWHHFVSICDTLENMAN